MRSKAIIAVVALGAALVVFAATPAKSTNPTGAKKTAKKASTAKTGKAKGIAAAKSTAGKKAASSKKSASTKQTSSRYRRSTQREPAPDRYMEIQRSLAEKGYYSGPVNGTWGPDSVEALRRFQRDQNIDDDGKLGALSLIALGLGPKRNAGAEKPEIPSPGASPP